MEQQTKKPNIIAISCVFLALSTLFIALAYGYGEATQLRNDNKWYTNIDNLEKFAKSLGYNLVKINNENTISNYEFSNNATWEHENSYQIVDVNYTNNIT